MDTENNIKENCLKIKIERNSYKNGALIFSIFNSETGHYDKANDLSDQNPLLKFTSETKELSEYADELILKLIETYKRLDTVQILFRGIPEDYSILSDSLNRNAGQNTGFVIIPNNYMSPGDLCDFVNKCVDTLNKKVKNANFFKK